jgi:hypothetical protein
MHDSRADGPGAMLGEALVWLRGSKAHLSGGLREGFTVSSGVDKILLR